MFRSIALVAAAAAALLPAAAAASLDGIDPLVAAAMKEWKVPGLALAVVKDGQVIYSKAHGLRDVERKLPVTTRTMFGIGSITKSFTVLALESLAGEGKLDWDKPVRDYVPDFRLHDPMASALATARDLVSHRTGLPRHDGMWASTGMSRAEIFARLRHLEPSRDFRSTYQYNNLMFLAAGVLAERISGQSWEELVRRRLLEPIGMTAANYSVDDSLRSGDWALNYGEAGTEIPPSRGVEAICPAGCINANLDEMTRYLRFHLGRGKLDGNAVMPQAQLDHMLTPATPVPAGGFGPEALGPTSYALGLDIARHRGHRMVFHTGTIGGYHALLAFLPEDGMGAVVLQNRVARAVPQVLAWSVFDRLLGLEPRDWMAEFIRTDAEQKAKTDAEKKAAEAKRKPGTQPSHSLAAYAGAYQHAGYGAIRVELKDGELELGFGSRPARKLAHFHYDVFSLGEQQRVRFLTGVDGDIDQVAIRLEPAVREIVFDRVGGKQ